MVRDVCGEDGHVSRRRRRRRQRQEHGADCFGFGVDQWHVSLRVQDHRRPRSGALVDVVRGEDGEAADFVGLFVALFPQTLGLGIRQLLPQRFRRFGQEPLRLALRLWRRRRPRRDNGELPLAEGSHEEGRRSGSGRVQGKRRARRRRRRRRRVRSAARLATQPAAPGLEREARLRRHRRESELDDFQRDAARHVAHAHHVREAHQRALLRLRSRVLELRALAEAFQQLLMGLAVVGPGLSVVRRLQRGEPFQESCILGVDVLEEALAAEDVQRLDRMAVSGCRRRLRHDERHLLQ
mmetsp:Transcript_31856/g.112124  ORF Transcript_31856/g.112124 Transcript_31856/m.112124 type:complete len:296 (-) Transcript_31856:697-1584(-)